MIYFTEISVLIKRCHKILGTSFLKLQAWETVATIMFSGEDVKEQCSFNQWKWIKKGKNILSTFI